MISNVLIPVARMFTHTHTHAHTETVCRGHRYHLDGISGTEKRQKSREEQLWRILIVLFKMWVFLNWLGF